MTMYIPSIYFDTYHSLLPMHCIAYNYISPIQSIWNNHHCHHTCTGRCAHARLVFSHFVSHSKPHRLGPWPCRDRTLERLSEPRLWRRFPASGDALCTASDHVMVIFSLLQGLKNLARRSQGGAGIIPVASKSQRILARCSDSFYLDLHSLVRPQE